VNDTMIVSVGVVSRPWLQKLPVSLRQTVIDEGHKLQARINPHSRVLDEGMAKRWQEAGGELVKLSDADQGRVKQLLSGVGDEVTKDNPSVSAFYKRLKSTAEKY
jgi:TRAP-type C4-dicarboxylate transport system substrate-binding protein